MLLRALLHAAKGGLLGFCQAAGNLNRRGASVSMACYCPADAKMSCCGPDS